MLKSYIGKKCKINISLAQYTSGGSAPLKVDGIIVAADDEFIEIEYDINDKNLHSSLKGTSGKMLIKRSYIISIALF